MSSRTTGRLDPDPPATGQKFYDRDKAARERQERKDLAAAAAAQAQQDTSSPSSDETPVKGPSSGGPTGSSPNPVLEKLKQVLPAAASSNLPKDLPKVTPARMASPMKTETQAPGIDQTPKPSPKGTPAITPELHTSSLFAKMGSTQLSTKGVQQPARTVTDQPNGSSKVAFATLIKTEIPPSTPEEGTPASVGSTPASVGSMNRRIEARIDEVETYATATMDNATLQEKINYTRHEAIMDSIQHTVGKSNDRMDALVDEQKAINQTVATIRQDVKLVQGLNGDDMKATISEAIKSLDAQTNARTDKLMVNLSTRLSAKFNTVEQQFVKHAEDSNVQRDELVSKLVTRLNDDNDSARFWQLTAENDA